MLLFKRYCCFPNETREKKQVQVELEDDEKLIVSLLQANETKWNLIIENKIRIKR
jgi:hypothetical protein